MSAVFNIAAAQQAKAIGKYNKQIAERNALVKEQEAQAIQNKLELDIQRFDKKFTELQGKTKTAVLKSGATLSGSGLRILRYNAEQAEVEKNIMSYNAKIGQQRKFEEANFARMRGSLARMEAKQAELGYYAQAGESLLKMYGDS